MSHRSLLSAIALTVVVSAGLAGCSSSPDKNSGALDPMDSPLQEYWSAIYPQMDNDGYAAQAKEVEELVAACMSDEGFEYIPVDQSQYSSGSSVDFEDTNTEEWVAANGYGMSQTPEQIEEMNEQAEEYVDPNQPYVESLSEGEQTAYYEVLYGPGPTDEELDDDGSYEYNWETAGCQGAAQHEVNGEDVTGSDEFAGLMEEMNEVYTDVQSAPGMAALDAEWASCMADAGYADFSVKGDAINQAIEESNALYEDMDPNSTGPTDEARAEQRENEIEIALADFTCSEETDYSNTSLGIQFALEDQFIADHKAELDALVAAATQGK